MSPNAQPLEMLFSCCKPFDTMVLFVCHATPYYHNAHLVGIPPGAHYVVYMLLLAGKHILMPFSYTNNNMHVGSMLRLSKYSRHNTSQVRKTFDEFMKANMHQKFCPIQALPSQHIADSILCKFTFT